MAITLKKSGVSLVKGQYAVVDALPACNICQHISLPTGHDTVQPARYDGRTSNGQWAFMCPDHFKSHAVSAHPSIGLGTGKGQMLILEGEFNG